MSMNPFFITGANAKVILNGKTVAFCTDLSYSIQILTQTPKILGLMEGSSVEPLGYSVSGSFSIIRYARNAISNTNTQPFGTKNKGNGIGNYASELLKNGVNDSPLNPADLANGSTMDIVVYQKTPSGNIGVVNIRNARITQADFSISKKSPAMQKFSFIALYASEDSFDTSPSGTHQFT